MYKIKEIKEAIAQFKDEDDVRVRHDYLRNDIDEEHVTARYVTYVELTFHHRMPPQRNRNDRNNNQSRTTHNRQR